MDEEPSAACGGSSEGDESEAVEIWEREANEISGTAIGHNGPADVQLNIGCYTPQGV